MNIASGTEKKVCFIAGAGHSGSTLLGLILGSHSRGFYGGEYRKTLYLNNPEAPRRKRICKFCGPDCPLWSTIAFEPDRNIYEPIFRQVDRSLFESIAGAINRPWEWNH